MATATTAPLRSLRVVSVAIFVTGPQPTVHRPEEPDRDTARVSGAASWAPAATGGSGWIGRVHTERVERLLVAVWSVLVAAVVLGPALAPGLVLVRDMVWVPDLALGTDALGLGSGLPRAVPSDAVVAVLDEVLPGALLQKVVLLAALAAGGVGATRLLPAASPLVARLAVVTLHGWNALVAERLLMGAWPVLVGYAVLPWLLLAARRWRDADALPPVLLLLVPLGSLSASAGLASGVALLAGAAGRGRSAKVVLLLAAANAPWWVAGLLHAGEATSDPLAAGVFALHDERSVPGPLAALTLGGIWNTDVQLGTDLLAWATLVVLGALVAAGWSRWWRATPGRDRITLLACWVVGWGLATLTWVAPGAVGWLAAHVPGAGVVRDGARVLVLCAPLLVVLVGAGVTRLLEAVPGRAARLALGSAAVLLPVALLPDLAWGAGQRLHAVSLPPAYAEARAAVHDLPGDVLVLPLSSYRAPEWNAATPVLDPLGRALGVGVVTSDLLVVDGVALAGEDPRVTAAAAALAEPTPQGRAAALAGEGVGAVVIDLSAPGGAQVPAVAGTTVLDAGGLRVVSLPAVVPRTVPGWWVAAAAAGWAAFVALPLTAAVLGLPGALRRARTRRGTRE
jgi:hypothetical protein